MRLKDVRPRAECYHCGDDWALRNDGLIRRHRGDDAEPGYFCPGSLRPPKTEVVRIAHALARLQGRAS